MDRRKSLSLTNIFVPIKNDPTDSELIKKDIVTSNDIIQKNAIGQIIKFRKLSIGNNLYKKYLLRNYHFLMFDIVKNEKMCKKIACMFSDFPDIFLGDKRTEIQISGESVTLSLNEWIKCRSLPNLSNDDYKIKIDYFVEYYIRVIDNFPVAILFRIKKDVNDCEEKLRNYIDCLTNNFDPYKNTMLDTVQNQIQMIEDVTISHFEGDNKGKLVDIIIPNHKTAKNISDDHDQTVSLISIEDKVTDIIADETIVNKYDAKMIIFLITIISVCVSVSFYSSYVYMENIDKSNTK
ncbi:MAG: hypothetical protein Terrestrivirus1_260 [Terrestrivirus sp.]|uniref:Uncharacterized protein n=1 Tax=Terrestrivirus sp. TaxID=2487775 RepID=A0A3G4ZKL8_9VIRU|nr:MAG: hypothetical protein Terrestrivirus1_260 [Terrestrivirus sp.]